MVGCDVEEYGAHSLHRGLGGGGYEDRQHFGRLARDTLAERVPLTIPPPLRGAVLDRSPCEFSGGGQ